MNSVFINIVNISLIASILAIVYLLVLDGKINSETSLPESNDIFYSYPPQSISIKQIDSLSALVNFQFSKHYAHNQLPLKFR
jgi:hypothetical protein